jgi:hypothetical protein
MESQTCAQINETEGDIVTRVKGYLSFVCSKDKHGMYVLSNMHPPPVDGNFRDESGHVYNAHMGFVDKSDRMVNSYGIAQRTWSWTKKLFFHLLDMTILYAYLLHKSYGRKVTHKQILQNPICLKFQEKKLWASIIEMIFCIS